LLKGEDLLYYIGKARDEHANASPKNLSSGRPVMKCEMREIHPERFDPWRGILAKRVLLDPGVA